jgi:hypothetical protein
MSAEKSPARLAGETLHYNARMHTSRGGLGRLALVTITSLFIAAHAAAQSAPAERPNVSQKSATLPLADPIPPAITRPENLAAPPHPFWDRTNLMLFSGVAIFRGLDYASTRNMQARGREEVLLPDDVVNNSAGFASLELAGTAASVGLSYWMHRTGHHKLERWISIVHIGITGVGIARNYALPTNRAGR